MATSPPAQRFELVIFDLDGTLIDSVGDLHSAVNRMLADFGCAPLELTQLRSMVGDGAAMLIARALQARECATADPAAALQVFLKYYQEQPATLTKLYPSVRESLELLSNNGVTLAVCTNKPARLTHLILEEFDIQRYFAGVLGGDSLPFRKPDPRTLTRLLSDLDGAATGSLLVGDSEVDAATARAAGVSFALMTYGYRRGPVDEIPHLAAFDDFRELTAFVRG